MVTTWWKWSRAIVSRVKNKERMETTEVTKVTRYSIALMAITSIHHAYGAYIYHTPWRLHVLMLSIPVIVLTMLLHRRLQKKEDNRQKRSSGYTGSLCSSRRLFLLDRSKVCTITSSRVYCSSEVYVMIFCFSYSAANVWAAERSPLRTHRRSASSGRRSTGDPFYPADKERLKKERFKA